jgi:acyl-CoA thioester hydrolase
VSRSLYKQTMLDDLRDVTNDAAAPRVVTPPGGALPPHDIQFRVRYAETDQMGVVYHTNYLIWCEVGRTDFIRARGMSYADIERSGVGLAVSDLEARYHGAARYDNLIRVRTTLADVRSRSITFDYVITNAETNERLVSARTTLVSIDKNGRLVAIPSAVRDLFHPHPSTLPTTIRSRRRRIANGSTSHRCATRGGFRGRRSRRYGRVPPAATFAFDWRPGGADTTAARRDRTRASPLRVQLGGQPIHDGHPRGGLGPHRRP